MGVFVAQGCDYDYKRPHRRPRRRRLQRRRRLHRSTSHTVRPAARSSVHFHVSRDDDYDNQVCEQKSDRDVRAVISATETSDGGLNLSGNPTTLVCGGPDDYHYNVATTVEAVLVVPAATIEVLPLQENMQEREDPGEPAVGLPEDRHGHPDLPRRRDRSMR